MIIAIKLTFKEKKKDQNLMIITIISTDESIAILVFQLSIDIFFCLLHSNIHVSI